MILFNRSISRIYIWLECRLELSIFRPVEPEEQSAAKIGIKIKIGQVKELISLCLSNSGRSLEIRADVE